MGISEETDGLRYCLHRRVGHEAVLFQDVCQRSDGVEEEGLKSAEAPVGFLRFLRDLGA